VRSFYGVDIDISLTPSNRFSPAIHFPRQTLIVRCSGIADGIATFRPTPNVAPGGRATVCKVRFCAVGVRLQNNCPPEQQHFARRYAAEFGSTLALGLCRLLTITYERVFSPDALSGLASYLLF